MPFDVPGAARLKIARFLLVLLAGIFLGTNLTAQSPGERRTPRITTPVIEANRISLSGNVHPLASPAHDQGAAPLTSHTGRTQLVLRRSAAQQLALTQYLADVQNPHSPSYHQWMTPAQYGAAFGISDADLTVLEQWLQGHGLQIERVSPARNIVQFSGNFAQIEGAFHTRMHVFAVNGVRHSANVADPQIPAALQPVIAGVGPLHDFYPRSQAKYGSSGHFDDAAKRIQSDFTLFTSNGSPLLYVDPADAAIIYNTPNPTLNPAYTGTAYDGTGINIGIAGDSNISLQDVTNYRVAFLNESAAAANVPTVVVDGNDPLINGDEAEALLDTEVAGAIAPKAQLYLYTAANTNLQSGLFDAILRALDDNLVSILNISFGECEAGLGTSGNQLVLELMQQAAAQGISVTVSSGDDGSAGCDSAAQEAAQSGLAVSGLASTPYNIAVGGTDYAALLGNFTTYVSDQRNGKPNSGVPPYYGTALGYIPERPWNDSTYPNDNAASNNPISNNGHTNIVAGSGGASSCVSSVTNPDNSVTCGGGYPKPGFQVALTPADGARDLPDVSFLAANGLYGAVWLVCADNIAVGAVTRTFTDCQTVNGQFTSASTFSGFGGTSAAAPAFAGMLALVEQKTGSRLGQANNILYQLAQSKYSTVFHDVTVGDNSVVCVTGSPNCGANGFLTGYDAAAGYDLASGLGSVDVTQMVNNWSAVALTSTTTLLNINGSVAPLVVTHGTPLTLNVAVTPAAAAGVVGIVDTANESSGGPQSGAQNNGQIAIPLSGGNGSVTYNGLPGGTYSVFAHYSGDASDAASTSSPGIQVTVNPEASTTGLTVTAFSAATPNPPVPSLASVPYGSYVLANTQIAGQAEGANTQGVATGKVTITDNGSPLGSSLSINAANQSFYVTPSPAAPTVFAPGPHQLVANYPGDASYSASSSTPVSFNVVQGNTKVGISATNSSIDSSASTLLSLDINTTSLGAFPTGTLTVTSNGKTLATITRFRPQFDDAGDDDSAATLNVQGSALAVGANTITATYTGDANYTGSTASLTINVAAGDFTLSSAASLTLMAGATSGNTTPIAITPSNGLTGIVTLSCAITTTPANAVSPATCALPPTANITGVAAATAALTVNTTSATTPGAYVITVTGVDASTGKISHSANLTATVTGPPPSPGFALSNSGPITVAPGATSGDTSTISITPSAGFSGQVNLSCAVATAVANATAVPTCSIPGSVAVSASGAATTTLTVTTTANSSALDVPLRFGWSSATLAGLLLFGAPRRRRWTSLFTLLLLVIAAGSAMGCGGSSKTPSTIAGGGTTAGAYTVTVTGTDAATGKISGTTAVNVNVN